MTIQTAITKAIEGGWDILGVREIGGVKQKIAMEWILERIESVVLDPLFWQALGKNLNWENEIIEYKIGKRKVETINGDFIRPAHTVRRRAKGGKTKWKRMWHSLIDHLAEGRTIESWFADLDK